MDVMANWQGLQLLQLRFRSVFGVACAIVLGLSGCGGQPSSDVTSQDQAETEVDPRPFSERLAEAIEHDGDPYQVVDAVPPVAGFETYHFAMRPGGNQMMVYRRSKETQDFTHEYWDLQTRKKTRDLEIDIETGRMADQFSSDGNWLAPSISSEVAIYDAETGKKKIFLDAQAVDPLTYYMTFSSDSSRLIVMSRAENTLTVWDVANGKLVNEFPNLTEVIPLLDPYAIPGVTQVLLTHDFAGFYRVDYETGEVLNVTREDSLLTRRAQVQVSADGKYFTWNGMGDAEIMEVATGSVKQAFPDGVYPSAFLGGVNVQVAVMDDQIQLWDAELGERLATFTAAEPGLEHLPVAARGSKDGSILVTKDRDGTMKFWQLAK